MGYEHVDQVLESDRYKGPRKAVLLALVQHINNERAEQGNFKVWPATERLIKLSGWSRSTVQREIDALCADKDPVVELVKQGTGTESSIYFIHMDRVGGVGEPLVSDEHQVVSERHHVVSERGERCQSDTTVVSEGHPNREENQEENQEGTREGKTEYSLSLSSAGNDHLKTKGTASPQTPPLSKATPQTSGASLPNPHQGLCPVDPGVRGETPASLANARPPVPSPPAAEMRKCAVCKEEFHAPYGGRICDECNAIDKDMDRLAQTLTPPTKKADPRAVWMDWTKEARQAYFDLWPEAQRRAYKLETLFTAMTDKPAKSEDFQTLLDAGEEGPTIGEVIVWSAEHSDGHWEFHNSKHFCKDTVYPVVKQQYEAWTKKQKKAKRVA